MSCLNLNLVCFVTKILSEEILTSLHAVEQGSATYMTDLRPNSKGGIQILEKSFAGNRDIKLSKIIQARG